MSNFSYSVNQLSALYELGRLYYRTGYYASAERIFHGVDAIDSGQTAAKIGLALIKLERGFYADSEEYFRSALNDTPFKLQAKLGLVLAFIAQSEIVRARSLLEEIDNETATNVSLSGDLKQLIRTLFKACE